MGILTHLSIYFIENKNLNYINLIVYFIGICNEFKK